MRKIFCKLNILLIFFFFIAQHVFASEEKTLGEIRKELLGKEVIIKGTNFPVGEIVFHEEVFLDWELAEGNIQEGFKIKQNNDGIELKAPYKLKGSRGVIESIKPSAYELKRRKNGTSNDAFGDSINDDDFLDPMFIVVVKLQDGTHLTASESYAGIMDGYNLELASKISSFTEEVSNNIDSLIGKTIFPVAYSEIYSIDADIKDFKSISNKLIHVPNLTPLKIIKARYSEIDNIVLLKVEFLGNRNGIIFSELRDDVFAQKKPFLEKVTRGFLDEIPKYHTAKEIKAIREASIFKGMSYSALCDSLGFPRQKNQLGGAKEQLVYNNNLLIYTDNSEITNWQSFSK